MYLGYQQLLHNDYRSHYVIIILLDYVIIIIIECTIVYKYIMYMYENLK